MNIIPSPRKNEKPKRPAEEKAKRPTKPPPAPFFAPKNKITSTPAIPSSSPAFATPVHPLRPFQPPAPAKAAILPIILPPPTLRPLAFRTFTKKHNLTLTSSALQELATFIGRHCGSGWREEGLAEKVLEEVARGWKNRNGGVIVDGSSPELKDILKNLEGNMSGGKIISGPRATGAGSLSRQNSLLLDSTDDHSKTRLGLRPSAAASLLREDSQNSSFGASSMQLDDEVDDDNNDQDEHSAAQKDPRRWLKVINSFEQPRFTYNVSKKHFERVSVKPSLLPAPSHKTEAFRNRLAVIHQRLMRNEMFQTSSVSRSDKKLYHKLTPIANLLGRHGSTHMLLGMLVVLPTGNLAISDLTGTITLDLSHAVIIPADSAWFTPGMIVLIDGIYEEEEESVGKGLGGASGVGGVIGGKFQGLFVGQPPCEKRKVTLGTSTGDSDGMVGGGFGWIDFLGVGSERAVGVKMRRLEQRLLRHHQQQKQQQAQATSINGLESPGGGRGRMVILGELNLDQPRSLQALRKVLSLYASDLEGNTPMTFVVAGNFMNTAVMAGNKGGSIEYKEAFDGLAGALADFPGLLTTATFVFVPGDNDGWASAFGGGAAVPLPRKGVPDLFTSRVRRVFAAANQEAGLSSNSGQGGEAVWTSNPSRLSLFGPNHEIVLFRDDISARLRRASVRLKSEHSSSRGEEDGDVTMSGANLAAEEEDDSMDVDDGPSLSTKKQPAAVPEEEEVPYDIKAARKLVKTLLDQGYLAPFRQSIRPVHWDYTTPMYLYPLPTSMVLVDTTAPPFCVTYEGCHVMNPGSILVSGKKGVARWIEYDIGRVGKVRECTF
ncbi:DNA polymerase [Podospora fimiseda]|uniref:DNA polymerase epsilon subunit B n=1 Tax=Podospora fimiseda TaxID=252190 RepID=A0AAN7BWD7_9PEZI|nr:DNA polymerase [Podospora fimiseda]